MGATGDPEGLQGYTVYQGSQVRDGNIQVSWTCIDDVSIKQCSSFLSLSVEFTKSSTVKFLFNLRLSMKIINCKVLVQFEIVNGNYRL